MSERERRRFHYERERALRDQPDAPDEPEDATPADAAQRRVDQQAQWVDLQVRAAIERGDFDDLPGAGKPLTGLDPHGTHDPDWWLKQLIAREKITGVLPPALALRKEDSELTALLDREPTPEAVRRVIEDFNRRVVEARRQLAGGPPVVTPLRDVDEEVAAWERRRAERRTAAAARLKREAPPKPRAWWRRR